MADKQLAIHEKNIGFDAGEAVVERIQERTVVQIIIVRMRQGQGRDNRGFLRPNRWDSHRGHHHESGRADE